MERKRILILGGGFGGLACARKLANRPDFEVTLIDRTNHHLFQPLLYQVATASLAAPDIARSLREILQRAPNVKVLMDEVCRIDPKQKHVHGQSGRIYEWDVLVLATGARTSFFGNDEWSEHVFGLKSLEEAQAIRRRVLSNLERAERCDDPAERERLMTVAIVGGGPTGVELAGAFADLVQRAMNRQFRHIDPRSLRVVLVEAGPRLLEPYDEEQSDYAKQRLESLGVEVWTGRSVNKVTRETLHFAGDLTLEAGAIIWAAGIQASPLTRQLGVEPADAKGRMTPERDLSLPGHPDIFVVGDLVMMRDIDDKPVPGVAPAAVQMGEHVAKVLIEDGRLASTSWADRAHDLRPGFRYRDKGLMAIIGKNHAVVKSGKLRMRGFPAWMAWLLVHILFLIGFRNKLAVLLGWAFAYLRNKPGARIIVHPPTEKEPPDS